MPAMWMAGGAALGAAGNIFSSIFGSSAAKQQASAIRDAAQTAANTALTLNDRSRADLAPFRDVGTKAGRLLTDIMNGGDISSLLKNNDALFGFQTETGTRNLNRELSARGLYNSGAGLEALSKFNSQLMGQEGQYYMGNLQSIFGMGENAAAQQASNTTQTGNNVANLQMNAGAAAGAATAQSINAIGSIGTGIAQPFVNAENSYMQYQMYKPFFDSFNKPSGGGADWTTNNTSVLPENQLATFN